MQNHLQNIHWKAWGISRKFIYWYQILVRLTWSPWKINLSMKVHLSPHEDINKVPYMNHTGKIYSNNLKSPPLSGKFCILSLLHIVYTLFAIHIICSLVHIHHLPIEYIEWRKINKNKENKRISISFVDNEGKIIKKMITSYLLLSFLTSNNFLEKDFSEHS